MCYSAQIKADYGKFVREFGAVMDIHAFVRLFWEKRKDGGWTKLPKALRDAFRKPETEEGFELAKLVAEGDRELAAELEAGLATQRERLAKAEAKLAGPKPTKTAAEEKRKALNNIKAAERNLAKLSRRDPEPGDTRIFPDWYTPVLIVENGRRVVKPMRYHCRLAGMPASSDWVIDRVTKRKTISGTYNARRDNLKRFWRKQYGHTHGIIVVTKFYEHVERDGKDTILEFTPNTGEEMIVACLWSHWTDESGKGEPDLDSFAAITDDPPPEIAATGHDRCIIPIKPEHVDAWLNPDPNNLAALDAILDDRPRPYYEHRIDKAA